MVRTMTIDDYEEVSLLWHKIKGFSPLNANIL